MTKIIFKFTLAVASAIGSHTAAPKLDMPKMPKPEIRVEKTKIEQVKEVPQLVENKKTALS